MDQLSLSDMIYLHRLFHGDVVRGRNELTRALESMMEQKVKELALMPLTPSMRLRRGNE